MYKPKSIEFNNYLKGNVLRLADNKVPNSLDQSRIQRIRKIIVYDTPEFNLNLLQDFSELKHLEFYKSPHGIKLDFGKNDKIKNIIIHRPVLNRGILTHILNLFPQVENLELTNQTNSEDLGVISTNTSLKHIKLVKTQLTISRLDNCHNLTELYLENNPRITILNINLNPKLQIIHLADNNNLIELNISGIGVLENLSILGGKKILINVTQSIIKNLKYNMVGNITISNPDKIHNLEIESSILSEVDLDQICPIHSLKIKDSEFDKFDFSKFKNRMNNLDTIQLENLFLPDFVFNLDQLNELPCNNLYLSKSLVGELDIKQIQGKSIVIID